MMPRLQLLRCTALAILLLAACTAQATTSRVAIIRIQYATAAELNETVIQTGALVYDQDDPHNVRVGDGSTVGGNRIWNTAALTAPPPDYYYALNMHGNQIDYSSRYSVQAGAYFWRVAAHGTPILSIVSESVALGAVLSTTFDRASNDLVVVVSVADTNVSPVVQYSNVSPEGPWTNCTYLWDALTATSLQFRVDIPAEDDLGYVAIVASVSETITAAWPIVAPAFVGDASGLTNGPWTTGTPVYVESDPIWGAEKSGYATGTPLYVETDPLFSASVAYSISGADTANWASAYGWGDHASPGYATGTPLYVYVETDPVWAVASNGYLVATNGAAEGQVPTMVGGTVVWSDSSSGGGTDTGAVQKVGDTMTGPLSILDNLTITSPTGEVMQIYTTNSNIAIGRSASAPTVAGEGEGIAIGQAANGGRNSIAIGASANGYQGGVAIGASANGRISGAVVGNSANGYNGGAAVGCAVNASTYGAVVGGCANGSSYGAAVGASANAYGYGIAIGNLANGNGTNIAIGVAAAAQGLNRIAFGQRTTNSVDNSAAIRGDLYIDGATGVYCRATFGSGTWDGAVIFDHAATQIIFHCGGAIWTNKP